jgi:hypothetical protein
MKQAKSKNETALKLGKRLALVRTTIRELNPTQLQGVNAAGVAAKTQSPAEYEFPTCGEFYTM